MSAGDIILIGAAVVLWVGLLWRLIHRGVDLREHDRRDDRRPW